MVMRGISGGYFMFVVADSGLQDGLVGSAASAHDSDHGSGVTDNGLSGAGWESHSGLGTVFRMPDDGGVTSSGSGNISY